MIKAKVDKLIDWYVATCPRSTLIIYLASKIYGIFGPRFLQGRGKGGEQCLKYLIFLLPLASLSSSIAKKHQTLLARGKGGPSRINTYYTLDTITGHETIPTPIDNILMFWTFVSRFPFVGKLCKDIGICGWNHWGLGRIDGYHLPSQIHSVSDQWPSVDKKNEMTRTL